MIFHFTTTIPESITPTPQPRRSAFQNIVSAPAAIAVHKQCIMTKNNAPKDNTVTITLRNPPYSYFHLRLQPLEQPSEQKFDELTLRSYLTAALQQYLGLTGTAIPIDILKVEDLNAWIRVPRDDEVAVTAAVTQWVGAKGVNLMIKARGTWLGGVVARGRRREKLLTLEEG